MVKDYRKKPNYISTKRFRNPKVFAEPKRRKKEKRSLNFVPLKYFAIIIVVLFCVYYFLFSPTFQIREIIVEGNNSVSDEEIINSLLLGQNILRFDVVEAETKLQQKYAQIRQINIYRGIPNALKVLIVERDGKMVWQSGEDKYFISAEGEVGQKTEATLDLPLVIDQKNLPMKVGVQTVSPSFVAFITNVHNSFYNEVNIKPTHFVITETTFDINLYTEAGFYVKMNTLRSSQKQLDNLKLVLMEKRPDIHEYIDLRIDGWAYYK